MKRKYESRVTSHEPRRKGSALILTVVLTTLLATLGVLFVLLSRIDKMAASAASENREINLAVETVIAKIKQELVLDVPGAAGQEYYDYPGPRDRWLASLEPNKSGNNYYWPQISDVYNKMRSNLRLQAVIVPDYQDANIMREGQIADADGDGVADSNWVIIPDVSSSKGRPIYAAIRIIDNGGMLNVNTAFKFNPADPCTTRIDIDGSSQRQINLAALSQRGANGTLAQAAGKLQAWRCGTEPTDLLLYEQNVIWRYGNPVGAYTTFDIGDELKLRNRYILNYNLMTSRIEELWTKVYDWGLEVPRTDPVLFAQNDESGRNYWFFRTYNGSADPNIYDYRHISTPCNTDRIIAPNGSKMLNVNTASAQQLYDVLNKFFAPVLAAQLALNIVDFRDNDVVVTTLLGRYGFEAQPFISEIAFNISGTRPDISTNNYFAIELYNPFEVPIPLGDFRLELRSSSDTLKINLAPYTIPVNGRLVITNNQEPNFVLAKYTQTTPPPNVNYSAERYDIYLLRRTPAQDIYLDRQLTQNTWFNWTAIQNIGQFYYRHDRNWNVVYQSLDPNSTGTLGMPNGGAGRTNYNIPTFTGGFVTVGDIARVLTVGPGPNPNDMIGVQLAAGPAEKDIRIDMANQALVNIFQYLTVFDPFDPVSYPWNDPNETRVKGRININTAPWFVIAQLPWIQYPAAILFDDKVKLAKAIVAYRDKLRLNGNVDYYTDKWGNGKTRKHGMGLKPIDPDVREDPGFGSVSELLNVTQQLSLPEANEPSYDIRGYGRDGKDQQGFPDLTTDPPRTGVDGAPDDFEEREVIFSRISNLVTVRSDVFTAYILVRIGANGPQRRVIAILDRSKVTSPTDKVKIIALQLVPDPR